MGESSVSRKWFRVVDRVSPLCGCDVTGEAAVDEKGEPVGFLEIKGLRRVDVLIGDRPYQLRAPDGGNLGILIKMQQLEDSPIQDEVIEIAYDSPYGRCIDEWSESEEGVSDIHVVVFEDAIQVALHDGAEHPELLASCTLRGQGRTEVLERILDAMHLGSGTDSAIEIMKTRGA